MLKILDTRYPERHWHSHSDGIKLLFGLTVKNKWPEAGLAPRSIQGIKVWVEPLKGSKPSHGKRHTHRALAECPFCGTILSIGRLHQHSCKEQQS